MTVAPASPVVLTGAPVLLAGAPPLPTGTRDPVSEGTGRVLVTGGSGPTGVDTEELLGLRGHLEQAQQLLRQARSWALDAADHLDTWAHLSPAEATRARQAVTDCVEGCRALESRIEELVDHLARAHAVYTEAEQHAAARFRPSLLQHLWMTTPAVRLPGLPMPLSPRGAGLLLRTAGTLLSGVGSGLPHAVVAQRAVRETAEDLQHAFPYYRREPVLLRGQRVDVLGLTPVQRVALGMLPLLSAMPAAAPTGRTLTGGSASVQVRPAGPTLPAARARPGAPRPGAPGAAAAPLLPVRRADPPRTAADLLRRAAELGDRSQGTGGGVVEVLRSTGTDGGRRWTVIVPGTQEQLPGGRNPMDNLTNVQAMAGAVSDMEVAVATAMRQAGIGPGEPVAMAVHSQGALVAARLLRDPLFASRYQVGTLLTAGGPVGGLELPRSVSALSLEDVDDPVVALDGLANAPAPHHVTVLTDTRGLDRAGSPHSLDSYTAGAELLDGVQDPSVQGWLARNRAVMGVDRPGAVTDSLVFDVVRPR